MELPADALQEAGLAEPLPFRLGGKRDVQRRDLAPPRHLDQRRDQRIGGVLARLGMDQQPRPGRRRERHGGHCSLG